MKIPSYCLFNTVLNKLVHITDVYIFSTRQNNYRIYKNVPIQKFKYPWILIIICVVSWMIHNFLFCVVIVVHESLVGPEQFNCLPFFREILQLLHILWFSSIFCIFEPFLTVTVWYWDPSFQTEGNWGTQTQLLQTIYWCSRRQHNALRARGCKLLNRMMMCTCFLFCFKIILFSIGTTLKKLNKYLNVSQKTKSVQFTLIIQFKSFPPPQLLMHCVAFLSISKYFHLIK